MNDIGIGKGGAKKIEVDSGFFDALFGQYYSFVGIKFEIGYAASGIVISLIEYYRGKHS